MFHFKSVKICNIKMIQLKGCEICWMRRCSYIVIEFLFTLMQKNKSNIKPMHIFILKKMMKQFYSSSDIWIVFVLMECWLQSSDVISKSYEYYTIQSAHTYTYTRVVHCISLEHKLFTCIESFHSKIIMIIMEKTKKKTKVNKL